MTRGSGIPGLPAGSAMPTVGRASNLRQREVLTVGKIQIRVSAAFGSPCANVLQRSLKNFLAVPFNPNITRLGPQFGPQIDTKSLHIMAMNFNRVVALYLRFDLGFSRLAFQYFDPVVAGSLRIGKNKIQSFREKIAYFAFEEGQR